MMVKLTARQRSQLPTCYYEGYLEKRSFRDKTSRKMWTCLCGNTLFFFNEKKDTDYIDKVDLKELVSITDDNSQDRNLDAARINLQLKDENIRLTAPNAEARELWKGFIRSVAELSVPASLNLLPGQIHMLKETVETEKARINTSAHNSLKGDMPACFHGVNRLEAALLLEREAKRGNLLLRPGSIENTFAVTTRQDIEGSKISHYRVTPRHKGGFVIDVDVPVPCATLHDVINYLVENTDGVLTPLISEEIYEKNIRFSRKDHENGEMSVQRVPTNLVPPTAPPRKDAPRIPTPEPPPKPTALHFYVNDKPEGKDKQTAPQPQLEKEAPKKAMMPPVPVPRKFTHSQSAATLDQRKRSLTDHQMPVTPKLIV
ncbi:signal-transducing adaptor protein 1-like isoform X2 [Cebidichthys violaceus]|uniref:signal-transducing adaptor protein 1-like isoform X2 n=1 Tax=Cebidichthys violaceus TaxID=271503 RepID=UPI0035CC8D63